MADTTVAERPGRAGRVVLRGGRLADGRPADIAIDPATGTIIDVGTVGPRPGDVEESCHEMVVVPSAVEVHGHLDKALTSTSSAMPVDLASAVADWLELAATLSVEDIVHRATTSVQEMVRRGYTSIRTHVDVSAGLGLRGIEALVQVRRAVQDRGLADLQLVALAAPPFDGGQRRLLEAAMARGADVVGGSPDLDPDPAAATAAAVDVAHRLGRPIDLHTDQTVESAQFDLPAYVELVGRSDVPLAAASHCVSLAAQPPDVQRATAERIAAVGMAVFTMPLTSLFFFGWDVPTAPPRGVTAIHALLEAGVTVAAGSDNVRDPFFPLGGFDPVETAATLAMVAHLTPEQAWRMCSEAPRTALGLAAVRVAPSYPADLLVIAGRSLADAIALRSDARIVLRRGRVVARTSTTTALLA